MMKDGKWMKIEVGEEKISLNFSHHCTTEDVTAMTLQMLDGLYRSCPEETKDMYAETITKLVPLCFISDDARRSILKELEELVAEKSKDCEFHVKKDSDVFNVISDWMKEALKDES